MENKKVKTCIILCAGFGKRMLHLTENMPKALLKINSKHTILDLIIDKLAKSTIENIIITSHHKWINIHRHIAHNISNINDKKISLVVEKNILGTRKGLLNAIKNIKEQYFLKINCDLIWDDNKMIDKIINFHADNNFPEILMLNKESDNKIENKFIVQDKYLMQNGDKNKVGYCGISIFNKNILLNSKHDCLGKLYIDLIPTHPNSNFLGYLITGDKFKHVGTISEFKS